MKFLAALVLLAPTLCLGSGAEDTEYYGRIENGPIVKVAFIEDGQPWSKRNFIYGSKTVSALAFCWSEMINEVPQSFVCTSSRGSGVTLTYAVAQLPDAATSAEYKQIARLAKLGNGSQRGDGILKAVYVCKTGCSASVPRNIYEVTKYD